MVFGLFYQYNFFESFLLKDDINIVYFISPSRFALDLDSLNYIFTVQVDKDTTSVAGLVVISTVLTLILLPFLLNLLLHFYN